MTSVAIRPEKIKDTVAAVLGDKVVGASSIEGAVRECDLLIVATGLAFGAAYGFAYALLGAELVNDYSQTLREHLGREPTQGEAYMAMFMGAGGAVRLLEASARTPAAD